MKNTISVLAIFSALFGGSAFAADLPARTAPVVAFVPPPSFSWTGPYVGLNIGGGWIDRNNNNNWNWGWNNNNGNNSGGVVGGAQLGWNYQLSPLFVVGLETDIQGTSIGSGGGNNNWWGWGDFNRVRVPWFGTVRGRVGLALLDSRLLIYGTGGFAYGEVNRPTIGWWGNNGNDVRSGWTAGGGVEWAFLPNWSAKVEYLYTELNDNANNNNNWLLLAPIVQPGIVGIGALTWNRRTQISTVRAGVNYHFNLFTPAPVVARY
ncbi:porin family protein [Methylosinus sporium]|uniref:Porin family protein n=1 Tax=Methylosinus sporium TaxID=428 RepID=A0A549SWA9_METSR|nr:MULTISPECIES: outer membrane beta-barrel protein [Methylosinus]MBU3888418.1 outer membrane beta-barrel protein [Methylosinus sp. KRF6]TRL33915.1 porin family protein [Methylosinus sporium]